MKQAGRLRLAKSKVVIGFSVRYPRLMGGIGHTLPFLISDFFYAMCVAVAIVAVELAVIAWIRHRYMDTPLVSAACQVILGGVLVFIVGILIGSA